MAAFHYDSKNKPGESMAAVHGCCALVGNINNPETLFARSPEHVNKEVLANLEAGIHMVGPECAIPLQTPIENLVEIPKAVREWHAGHVHTDDARSSRPS
jgi:[methyl-Co(III) methanol-specific corrinoid protein]:coenzyme M methyltransferase